MTSKTATSVVALQTTMIPVTDLIDYANNPRKNDKAVPGMVELIERFGFRVPILVRGNNIVDGHLRVKAAKVMGLTDIPAIDLGDMTDADEKALRIAINQTVSWAEWDNDKLAIEFKSIKEAGIDLKYTGFDKAILDSVMVGIQKTAPVIIPKTKSADAGTPADPDHVSISFNMGSDHRDLVLQFLHDVQVAEGLGNPSQALIHLAKKSQ